VAVLVAFFMVIVLIIPYYFYSYFNKVDTDVGGVHIRNRKIFAKLIGADMTAKSVPGMLCQTYEFRDAIKVRSKDELAKLKALKANADFACALPGVSTIQTEDDGKTEDFAVQVKPVLMLMAHMYD